MTYVVDWSTDIKISANVPQPKVVPSSKIEVKNTEIHPGEKTSIVFYIKNEGASGTGFIAITDNSNIDINIQLELVSLFTSKQYTEKFTVYKDRTAYVKFPIKSGEVYEVFIYITPDWSEIHEKTQIEIGLATGHVE